MATVEFLEQRKKGVGGSDAAAIAGFSRYKTPVDVYLQKIDTEQRPYEFSEPAYWGNVLEPIVAREYELRKVKKVVIEPRQLQHPDYPWMLANVDRLIEGENAVLECKTCSAYKAQEWGYEDTDEIPDEYLMQVAHYAIVCNADYVDIAVLIGGQEFRTYRYERSKELEENLIEVEANFWNNHVLKGIPPDPTNFNDVNNMWRNAKNSSKFMVPELNDHLKSYRFVTDKIKELEEQLDYDKQKICHFLGESQILIDTTGLQIATWKEQETERLQTKEFKKALPDIYKQFVKTTKNRVLRVREFK